MTIIYLIRHSKPLDVNNELSTDTLQIQNEKKVLSKEGENLAKNKFNNSIFNDIEVIFTSNYVRTIETAKYISENNDIKINILDELGERRFGISSWSEKPKDFERRQFLDENYKIGDGENKKEVEERMYDCILKILKENQNKTIAIVSHATAISYLLNKWCNIKIEDNMLSYKYNNKEILKGPINYCETLKLTFDIENNLKNIEKI